MSIAIAINIKDEESFKDMLDKAGVEKVESNSKNMMPAFFGVPIYTTHAVPIGEYWIGPEEKIAEAIAKANCKRILNDIGTNLATD